MKRATLLLAILLAGCGFFSQKKNTYYSLETIGPETAPAGAKRPLAIGGIELPPGIDRREIVVRGLNGTLDVRGTQLWAGPLQPMIIHTLAFDLAKRLPEGSVVLPGQAKPAGNVDTLFVVFEDLAAGPEPLFVLDARVTRGTTVTRERVTVPMDTTESRNVVQAMSTALAMLADRIAR